MARALTLFSSTSETGSRFNGNTSANGGLSGIFYTSAFLSNSSNQTAVDISSVSLGIRRISSGGQLTAVDGTIFAVPMLDNNMGDIPNQVILGTFSLSASPSASNVTQIVTVNSSGATLNLNNSIQSGFGGLWIGLQFTGSNAQNDFNGWRIVNLPVQTGSALNVFGGYNANNNGIFSTYTFSSGSNAFYATLDGTLLTPPTPVPFSFSPAAGLALAGSYNLLRKLRTRKA